MSIAEADKEKVDEEEVDEEEVDESTGGKENPIWFAIMPIACGDREVGTLRKTCNFRLVLDGPTHLFIYSAGPTNWETLTSTRRLARGVFSTSRRFWQNMPGLARTPEGTT